ncbi:bifunctional acetate--CoA ligase family protein/GNAT family N-acetyltransferase [Gimesia algae]|uniref:Succinyl-CoA ligase [ADP-forming] subunit alpha n=1 Tax=Gimesia algae TaxID=2527971 RepID=A0A517VEU3_9PLAN|nr:bifunctional acetate--CoA ligase family protein/GNAT family N-acetyltransferase [Gimesia algae]QDT91532.1 Succinyl-CoA ligase [ADP-forming] subunit alpha [Gimesia algae]
MSVRNLDKIFKPQRIAVVGASNNPTKVGFNVLSNLIGNGFRGVVYPVNPKYEAVQGISAYENVKTLPKQTDLAIVCTPAHTVPGIVRECGEAGIKGMVILSAGFRESGKEGQALEEQIREESRKIPDLRIIGPNCLGIIVPGLKLNASFAAMTPKPGHVAFVSQSGALCTAVLDWAVQEDIGFSHFVSIGNMLDVSYADLIDYFGQQSKIQSIILYVESITEARQFMSAARAFTKTKPIVAYKAGRFAESAKAATSHTGAMAGEDAVYDAAFQRAGIVRIYDFDEIFNCAELLSRHDLPKGARLAVVTNAGGPGVMATDALMACGGTLAQLSEETIQQLNNALPPYWSHGNPVDILGDASPKRFAEATQIVLKDPDVDAVLVVFTPQAMSDSMASAKVIGQSAQHSSKPVLTAWMGGRSVEEGINCLNKCDVPTYATPEQAVRAFMYLVSYRWNREILYETPRDIPWEFTLDNQRRKKELGSVLFEGPEILSENVSKELLATYEIPITRTFTARSADEAIEVAERIGYPVVLKVLSPQITHKTEVGGVLLHLNHSEDVRSAFQQITAKIRQVRPDAQIEGVTVQKMIASEQGLELIVGAKKDSTFGAIILVGTGGITAECFKDRILELPPLNERLARRMLESLKSWPLLKGYRGRPAVDLDRLIEVLIRFSYLVADSPEIKEFDINPLLVTPNDIIALDARVVIDKPLVNRAVRPYSHLAICPYPERFVRQDRLKNGEDVLLRPIRPEDEPMWHTLLVACTPESIHARFHSLFRSITHGMATRYCFIDYDREMAIVAEVKEKGERKLIGVGRLIAEPNHETAEYAILVVNPWQGKGLGTLLTRYCMEVAKSWGLQKVVAETDLDNQQMLATFRKQGFELRHDMDLGIVYASKKLN